EVSKAKSRWVPFEETLASELSDYLQQRTQINPATEDSRFLIQPNGSPCGRPIVSNAMIVLLRRAGLKPHTGRMGPRPYDTRHHADSPIMPTCPVHFIRIKDDPSISAITDSLKSA